MKLEYFPSEITKDATTSGFLEAEDAQFIASFFMLAAQILTLHHVLQHNARSPTKEKRRIVNILFIVPIYGCYSYLMLVCIDENFVYLLALRDCYGAFAIYNFLFLCYEYLGGQSNILVELCGRPMVASWMNGTGIYTLRFHYFCKHATVQFCIVKSCCSVIFLLINRVGKLQQEIYHDEDVSCTSGFYYLTIVLNVSAIVALYALFSLFRATRELIKPDPMLKFVIVIILIFFTYWQEIALVALEDIGVIVPAMDATGKIIEGKEAANCHNFLVCAQMLVAAIALRFAFPVPAKASSTHTVTMQSVSTGSLHSLL